MLTGLTIPEPGKNDRTVNEMCMMCTKFGGSTVDIPTAKGNAKEHCPEGMVEVCKTVNKDNFEQVRDELIKIYGNELELPIQDSGRGTIFANL